MDCTLCSGANVSSYPGIENYGCADCGNVWHSCTERIADLEAELREAQRGQRTAGNANDQLAAKLRNVQSYSDELLTRAEKAECELSALLSATRAKDDDPGDDWGNEYAAVVQFKRERDAATERIEKLEADHAEWHASKNATIRELHAELDTMETRLRMSANDLNETKDRYRLDISTPNRYGPDLYHALTVDSARWIREDGGENLLAAAISNYRAALADGPTWSDPLPGAEKTIRDLRARVEELESENDLLSDALNDAHSAAGDAALKGGE